MATAKTPGTTANNLVFELDDELQYGMNLKQGRFFSQKNHAVGSWKMVGNVLYLEFPGAGAPQTVIAKISSRHWTNPKTLLAVDVIEPSPTNPWWFEPDLISEDMHSENAVACREFECPVCYFELYKFPRAVVKKHSRRTCAHYFHKDCAEYLVREFRHSKTGATCPICGVPFSQVEPMPDLVTEPREWFSICDVDYGGELSEFEVIESLGSCLPVTRRKLTKQIRSHWHLWDPDGDGSISMQEFIIPHKGLRDWVLKNVDIMRSLEGSKGGVTSQLSIPALDKSPMQWFAWWDRDENGSLDRDEMIRSLIRTFCVDDRGKPSLSSAMDMREAAFGLWKSSGYTPFASITFDEFVKPYGLMDQFIHNQANCHYFGEDQELWAR